MLPVGAVVVFGLFDMVTHCSQKNACSHHYAALSLQRVVKKEIQMKTQNKQVPPTAVRLPPELKAWVKEQADKDRRSVSSWIQVLIEAKKGQSHVPA